MSDDFDAAAFGFDAYQTALGAGVASEEREKFTASFSGTFGSPSAALPRP